MTIDWKQETETRKEAFIEDLKSMLAVESVRDDSKATADAPLGPGPKDALVKVLSIAEGVGFSSKNLDNLAGFI